MLVGRTSDGWVGLQKQSPTYFPLEWGRTCRTCRTSFCTCVNGSVYLYSLLLYGPGEGEKSYKSYLLEGKVLPKVLPKSYLETEKSYPAEEGGNGQ